MRITSQATELYRRTSSLGETRSEKPAVQPQARTTTTSFGFRLGKFGMDYREETTVLDPSLSRDVRERRQKARAFRAEAEVEGLRAEVGATGAVFREGQSARSSTGTGVSDGEVPSRSRVRSALSAYARAAAQVFPPPGQMLAGVV
ncbi:hypothetical protein [Pseudodesulfovibrio indicus]|uniref:hypothetical protein n=1 Tax=Pseudodesulfovibrio indicus TaxID=1716143 RepID=UPI00292D8EBD|nr:hypothetical protein [Pseudodesulfovibrio indicus]